MTATEPWLPVFGYGGHIKATTQELIIADGSTIRRYPLQAVKHLLVVGGHTLHTSAVTNLLKAGAAITFFDIDGLPVGYLYPYGYRPDGAVREAQERAPPHRFAQHLATAALQSRLLHLEELSVVPGTRSSTPESSTSSTRPGRRSRPRSPWRNCGGSRA